MRKKNDEFLQFQKEFKKWQQRFGLTGYRVYYKYEPLAKCFAQLRTGNGHLQVATVVLNSKLPDKDKPFKDIKNTAKHEAIHLMLTRLMTNARWRYGDEEEINEAEEEIVVKLEDLIV